MVNECKVNNKNYVFAIEHVLSEDLALEMKQKLIEQIGECEILVRELPAVVGAHIEQSISSLHHRDNRDSPASLLFRIFLLKSGFQILLSSIAMLIHVSSFLSKTPVETLSEADASSAYPKVFNWSIYFCISSSEYIIIKELHNTQH